MAQLKMQLTDEFKKALTRFMELRNIKSRSEAVRIAVHEGLKNAEAKQGKTNFDAWLGAGLGPGFNPNPRFKSDDNLWEKC